jgi:hypothetical protein
MVDDNLTPSYWLFNVKSQLFAFSISLVFLFILVYVFYDLHCSTSSVLLYIKLFPLLL